MEKQLSQKEIITFLCDGLSLEDIKASKYRRNLRIKDSFKNDLATTNSKYMMRACKNVEKVVIGTLNKGLPQLTLTPKEEAEVEELKRRVDSLPEENLRTLATKSPTEDVQTENFHIFQIQ